MRPVIGISAYRETARWGVWERPVDLLPAKYADAVWQAGGQPLIVPALPGAAADVLGALDALLVAGGADVEPAAYGAEPHPMLGEVRPDRDATELGLVRQALAARKPLLGVCRGAQVLNVALGGTLHQHLPEVTGVEHRGAPGVYVPTEVRLAAGSRLAALLGERTEVCCYHHQALDRLGEGLVPVGSAPDGAIEAVELPGDDWVVGVQWHPEEGRDLRVFTALVEQATREAKER
ncbi:MAG: gamma-glutamyl-gamma-aminobutyrate hydrolase family protein [Actinomycetota bacterium]|nr:gamma-glutamyl-gamma-aminobutyrate hydrolase family protein [Actinomycetota bacterium]